MKHIIFAAFFLIAAVSCNAPEQNSATGNSEDSLSVKDDAGSGDTRGSKGSGLENSGGTPGPGTLTDTSRGKTDTLDHTSQKKN